jgi:hypothetical protein
MSNCYVGTSSRTGRHGFFFLLLFVPWCKGRGEGGGERDRSFSFHFACRSHEESVSCKNTAS